MGTRIWRPEYNDGKKIDANALWAKDIEIASRGCYSVRDRESSAEEMEAYGVGAGSVFSVWTFEKGNISSAADTIREILEMPPDHAEHDTRDSVSAIREGKGFEAIVEAIERDLDR